MTKPHHCNWPGCRAIVAADKWGCWNCWRRLPRNLQHAIWKSYKIGQEDKVPSREYLAAARLVQGFIETQTTKGERLRLF